MGTEVIRFRPSGRPVVPSLQENGSQETSFMAYSRGFDHTVSYFFRFFSFRLLIFDTSAVI